ncbi:hypothetical protein PMI17_00181 [Pantoea sp. GM01]|nr:hypothetical protein PMI17_00181 [Pantoea sp. GM01]
MVQEMARLRRLDAASEEVLAEYNDKFERLREFRKTHRYTIQCTG